MNNFALRTEICFGHGSLEKLRDLKDKKVMLITDPFMVKSGAIDKITSKLSKEKVEVFSDIVPDAPIGIIVKGIEVMQRVNPDAVIALGGGSAIDSAKAIMDFSRKILSLSKVKFYAIPTTSGTGSEVTSFAVIKDEDKGSKYPLVSDELLPDIAILDSELTMSVPPSITADTGMDVITHALEAYVSTEATDFSDALAEKALTLAFKYLVRAYKNGNDVEAREKMHSASCLAGIAFNSVSLGINHSIAHALGGKFHIPHGRANSILLPKVIEFNADIIGYESNKFSKAAEKYANIARLLGLSASNTRMGVRSLIHEIQKLQKEMNMPTNLRKCGVSKKDFDENKEEIANLAVKDPCTVTNPKVPTVLSIIEILKKIAD